MAISSNDFINLRQYDRDIGGVSKDLSLMCVHQKKRLGLIKSPALKKKEKFFVSAKKMEATGQVGDNKKRKKTFLPLPFWCGPGFLFGPK